MRRFFANKNEIYCEGLQLAKKFLDANLLLHPKFLTYEEAFTTKRNFTNLHALRLLDKVSGGPLVGSQTGLYSDGHIFVNVPVTAFPVTEPSARRWSWPGWKTDRTAIGVVAHELGHYIEHYLQELGKMTIDPHRAEWLDIINNYAKSYRRRKKQVSGYEPVPSEAWAESCRLFILNPDLLQQGIPERYNFIRRFVRPSETRPWYEVLDNANYIKHAERWMNA